MKAILGLLSLGFAASVFAQTPPPIRTGPAVGSFLPTFRAVDQNGVTRTSASLLRAKGALLVFFRSADW